MKPKKNSGLEHIVHPFSPFYDQDSKILVLGSFPSVKSREVSFYYGNPKNRFWHVLASIYNKKLPVTLDEKKTFLKDIYVALYDVIESCDIHASSDSSIKNATPSNISRIIAESKIELIVLNGKKAGELFQKYQAISLPDSVAFAILPSTSPANAACSLDDLIREWGNVLIGR